jgi:hypothetical protein
MWPPSLVLATPEGSDQGRVAAIFRQVLSSSSSERPHVTADGLMSDALDSQRPPAVSGEPARYDITVTHDGDSFLAVPPGDHTSWMRGDTVEQLRDRMADVIALWTQTPCGSDQVSCELDDAAQAANA